MAEVNKRLENEGPNIDYSLIDLVSEKLALEEKIYSESYESMTKKAKGDIDKSAFIKAQIVNMVTDPDVSEKNLDKFTGLSFLLLEERVTAISVHMDKELEEEKQMNEMERGTCILFIETYQSLRNHFLFEDPVDRVVAAQKITDMLLKAYSPAAFEPGKYAKFADNFFLNNEERLRDAMDSSYESFADSDEAFAEFMKEVNAARLGERRPKKTDEELEEENDEITNEDSEEVIEEQEETERETIPGLKEDVEGEVSTDRSARVMDEISKKAPNLQNK
jgi:hypothetical protein